MTFTTAIRTCLRKYATFSGRATRPEYWWFVLAVVLASFVIGLIDGLLFDTTTVQTDPGEVSVESNGPLSTLFSLATVLPMLAAGWRRMHDTGRSGLYLLYPMIVGIGTMTFLGTIAGFGPVMAGDFGAIFAGGIGIVLIVCLVVLVVSPFIVLWWLTRPSQPGANPYGPNPYGPNPSEVPK